MSDAEGRREARRKRILENSQSRLQKIASIHRKNDSEEELDEDSLGGFALRRQEHSRTPDKHNKSAVPHNEPSNGGAEIHTIFENLNPIVTNVSSGQLHTTKKLRHSIIVLLAIFIRLAKHIGSMYAISFNLYANKIFIPFLAFEVIVLVVDKAGDEQSSWLNALLLFTNIPPRALGTLMFYTNLFMRVLHDMFIYFFTFIMCDLCIKLVQ